MAVVGEIKTNPNNPNQKARWNGQVWEPVGASAGPKAAPAWGPGAVELPDTSVVRYGPQGGITVLKKAAPGGAGADEPLTLTEDQGKSQLQARLMAEAEQQYRQAKQMGYNPGELRTAAANYIEDFPILGGVLSGAASFLRPDEADLGRKAERAWNEAQTKAMTGAGQSKSEEVGGPRIYFPRAGEGALTEEASARIRQEAYRGAKMRAGPAGATLPIYPGEPGYSKSQPIDLSKRYTREAVARLPVGAHYRDAVGNIRKNVNGQSFLSDPTVGNPVVVPARAPAKAAPPKAAPQPGKRLRFNPETGEIE